MTNGVVTPIMRYSPINWTSLVSATEDVIVADQVPVPNYARIGLSARLHKLRLAASVTMQFIIYGQNPSESDGRDFIVYSGSSPLVLGSTATFDNTATTPSVIQLSTIISDCQHPMIRVILRTVAGATSGVNIAWLSADLVMRENS